jgi:hypothetical protein
MTIQTMRKEKRLKDFLDKMNEQKARRIDLILHNSYTHTLFVFHNNNKELLGYYISPMKYHSPTLVYPGIGLLDIANDHQTISKRIATLILEGKIKLPNAYDREDI